MVLVVFLAMAATEAGLSLTHRADVARDVVIAGAGLSPLLAAFFLRIDTPLSGRVFRCIKWVIMTGAILLLYGPDALKWSWLLSCLAPLVWTELTRASIRRKLPSEMWPRHLYL